MFAPGMFVNPAGTTPEDIARKRAEIAAMMPSFGNARYVGEGLGQLFAGIGLGRQQAALDKQEQAGRQSADERLRSVMGMRGTAQPGAFTVLGPMPAPLDPNSPEGIASDAMAALGRDTFTPGDRDSFVKAMMPHALRVSQETGLDPRLVIAQAAQETGWGKSAPNNNFFGIKSHGKGGATLGTFEYVNGQPVNVQDSFRTYGGMGESAADYARFLKENPRYAEMLSAPDLQGQLAALGASGYATDPNYAQSVGAIAQSIQMPGMNSPQTMAATIPVQDLMALATDPWQRPEVRQQAQAMLEQQQKMNDPAYALGLQADRLAIEKAQAEVEALRNPTPKQTDDMREYSFAVTQGYRGTFQDYMTEMKKAGASNTNISLGDGAPGLGKLSTDYGYVLDPETGKPKIDPATGLPQAAPVPGSPAAREMATAETQRDIKAGNAAIASETVTTAANRALTAAGNRAFGGVGQDIVSWLLPQSDAAEVKRQVDVLKSQAIVSNLQAMRNASPTGGALGAVTAPELELLANQAGALDPSSPTFERDVKDYTKNLLRTIHGPSEGDRLFEQWSSGDGWTDAGGGVRIREKK